MIGHLSGTAVAADLVDVHGVGYLVHCPRDLTPGEDVHLRVTTIVREDAITLYGFDDVDQQTVFAALVKVTGVGPRLALEILRSLGVSRTAAAIADGDSAAISSVRGVGRKTATMIVSTVTLPPGLVDRSLDTTAQRSAVQDASCALQALGWSPTDADRAARDAAGQYEQTSDIVRAALVAART